MGNRKQKGGDFNDFINWIKNLFGITNANSNDANNDVTINSNGENAPPSNKIGGGKKHKKSVKKSKGKKHQKSVKH